MKKQVLAKDCTELDIRSKQIIKTLSRTVRKDYENYVINAIWNKIYNESKKWTLKTGELFYLKPEGQRRFDCITSDDGVEVRFADLFFPQLNVGIECDEPFHDGQKEEDELRELSIIHERQMQQYEEFGDWHEKYKYHACHIKIAECKNIEDLHNQIDEAINFLIKRYNDMREAGALRNWQIYKADEFYKDKGIISVDSYVSFETVCMVLNTILDNDYKNIQSAYGYSRYGVKSGKNCKSKNFTTWFPVLSYALPAESYEKELKKIERKHVKGNARKLRNAIKIDEHGGCYFIKNNNFLNMRATDPKTECDIIYEWCPKHVGKKRKAVTKEIDKDGEPHPRITFGKRFNELTGRNEYNFIGVYIPTDEKCHSNGKIQRRIRIYKRIDTEFPICQNGKVEEFQAKVNQKMQEWIKNNPEIQIPFIPEQDQN